ncbi:hypothetical protein [Dawidia soli]|uniref:Uncharacterized protein n=1 Tax=Dawidia soli TaxID=2782352 RepID=A0AAP2GBH9_9BACT|nr:hypothetical protein [Dawidia soli]MBT1685159.1 hypothetical protein [Dawidia soli]
MEREGEILQRMYEQTRHYAFHNDQMLHGPLFRVKGMLQLLQQESRPAEQGKLLEMLLAEVEQMELSGDMMARMLAEYEARMRQLIEGGGQSSLPGPKA